MGGFETLITNQVSVPFIDVSEQYADIREDISLAIADCIQHGKFINGPEVNRFKEQLAAYLAVKHVTPCASGTDALKIALLALGLKPGDEVIVPAFGYISPAEVCTLLNLKPVFADVDPHTFNMDCCGLEKLMSQKTRAVIPVHLFGQGANMVEIMAFAKKHSLYVIEDNAQSLGAEYVFKDQLPKKLGTIGHIGTTSFFPTKNLGCFGDGGALFTNDADMGEKMNMIANHGQKQKYTYHLTGLNSRLDSIQAAVLNVKLPHLDAYNRQRRLIALLYDDMLEYKQGFVAPAASLQLGHIYHQYTIQCTDQSMRDRFKAHLSKHHISSMIYFPSPLHLQPAFRYLGYKSGDLPVSEALCNTVISLPVNPALSPTELNYIANTIECFKD